MQISQKLFEIQAWHQVPPIGIGLWQIE